MGTPGTLQGLLPSFMLHQTTDNFVWLIYTDPHLDQDLLDAMVELLAPHPRFFLIASLHNELWRGGQAQNMTDAMVYVGDEALLEETIVKRDMVPILETRLDADDALHRRYLEDIQREAADFFYRREVKWMYWCIKTELQWYWVGPKGVTEHQRKYGITEPFSKKRDFCPTPGLTIGYNVGVNVSSIYRRKHSLLIERLQKKTDKDLCGIGLKGLDCVQIVRKYPFPAIRTRTPTSSSMIMTEYDHDKLIEASKQNDTGFHTLASDFGIQKDLCGSSVMYLNDHIHDIAREALAGTCQGLFCPEGAKSRLERVIYQLMSDNATSK